MYESEQQLAAAIVAEVCGLTGRVQDRIVAAGDSLAKGDRSPVTLADLATQIVVSHRLKESFPADPLLAEEDSGALDASPEMAEKVFEQARRNISGITPEAMIEALDRGGHTGEGERYWVLDPIDGTKGFLRGDQYAVALALVDGGRVVVGGTTTRPLDGQEFVAARVDQITDPADAVFCESVVAAHAAHSVQAGIASRLGITAPSFRIDSQCKYAVVARGEASIYLRLPRDTSYREKVWDHAAGSLVLEEAGGRVSDLDGRPLDFSQGRLLGNHRGIVCTNGTIHEQVLAACRAELDLD